MKRFTNPAEEDPLERIEAHYHDRVPLDPSYNDLSKAVIGAAMAVHTALGPGFLESYYQRAMILELTHRNIPFQQQTPMSVSYRGTPIGDSFLDLLVDNRLVVELKSIESITMVHRMQVHSYMRAGGYQLGLIINFYVAHLRDGIARVINTPRI